MHTEILMDPSRQTWALFGLSWLNSFSQLRIFPFKCFFFFFFDMHLNPEVPSLAPNWVSLLPAPLPEQIYWSINDYELGAKIDVSLGKTMS